MYKIALYFLRCLTSWTGVIIHSCGTSNSEKLVFMDELLVMLIFILAACWLSEVTNGRQPRLTNATKDGDNPNHRLPLPLLCTPCLSHLFSSQVGLHLNNHWIFSFIQYTWVQSYMKGFPIYDTGFPMYEDRFPNVWWKVSQCMRKGFPRFPNVWGKVSQCVRKGFPIYEKGFHYIVKDSHCMM